MFETAMSSSMGIAFLESRLDYLADDPATALMTTSLWLLLFVGSLLMLLAAVGLIRLPDLPTRMHASTKAGSLGAALIMLGVAVAMPSADVVARSMAVIAFLLLTAPVAAHVIGRAGYFVGVPLWEGTVKDDLAEQYDYDRHTLASGKFGDREIEGFEDDGDAVEGDDEFVADNPYETPSTAGGEAEDIDDEKPEEVEDVEEEGEEEVEDVEEEAAEEDAEEVEDVEEEAVEEDAEEEAVEEDAEEEAVEEDAEEEAAEEDAEEVEDVEEEAAEEDVEEVEDEASDEEDPSEDDEESSSKKKANEGEQLEVEGA